MSERRVSNPLALAVLACLAEKPMHPYEIASTLRDRHKDESIKLNYGSLYSVIEGLCRNRLIAAKETIREGKRPERTVFELTEAGMVELHDWLGELLARPVKEYTQFEAGLSLMPVLPPETAASLLRQRAEAIEVELAKDRSVLEVTRTRNLPRLFVIEREYWMTLRRSELEFVRALAEDISKGRLDGLAEWRSWHLANDENA
jgi:DNA-binding PadR family transcriptional regulator